MSCLIYSLIFFIHSFDFHRFFSKPISYPYNSCSFSLIKKTATTNKVLSMRTNYSWEWLLPWNVADNSLLLLERGDGIPNKQLPTTNFYSLSNYQLWIASCLWVELHTYFGSSILGFRLAWAFSGLVYVVTILFIRASNLLCWENKSLLQSW